MTSTASAHDEEGEALPSPSCVNAAARQLVEEWRVQAIGNRPKDHMQRDLLHASLLRDRRCPMFHRITREPPDWIGDLTRHLRYRVRRLAEQHVALHYIHQRHLVQLRHNTTDLTDPREQLLNALQRCRPIGALLERSDSEEPTRCGRPKVCPWCHARKAYRLYRQLVEGPCRRDRLAGKHLFLVTLDLASYVPRLALPATDVLTREQCRHVRNRYLGSLLAIVRDLGCTGGLWTHQVSHWWTDEPQIDQRRCFLHHLAIVGEIDLTAPSVRQRFEQRAGIVPGGNIPCIYRGSSGWPSRWYALPAGAGDPVRLLLMGSPFGFEMAQSGLRRGTSALPGPGLSGALAYRPWFLFDAWQWWSYFQSTAGLRCQALFGTWREAVPERRRRALPLSGVGRLASGPRRRQRALAAANRKRCNQARERRETLLEQARPVFDELARSSRRRPGRAALQRACAEQGLELTERDARWLARHLR